MDRSFPTFPPGHSVGYQRVVPGGAGWSGRTGPDGPNDSTAVLEALAPRVALWKTSAVDVRVYVVREQIRNCCWNCMRRHARPGMTAASSEHADLAPRPGLEPGTCGLTVRRSTN